MSVQSRGDAIGEVQDLAADRLQVDLGGDQAGRHPLDHCPLPDRGRVEVVAFGHPAGGHQRVGRGRFVGVLAKDHAEVVLGVADEAIGVDEFEGVAGLQCVPLLDVAMEEQRVCSTAGGEPASSALDGMLDRPLGTGSVESPTWW